MKCGKGVDGEKVSRIGNLFLLLTVALFSGQNLDLV